MVRFRISGPLLAVVILLHGCGPAESPAPPLPTTTDTPRPPAAAPTLTGTPRPPAATPTPTPVPPTPTPVPPSPQPSATPTGTPEPRLTPTEEPLSLPAFVPGECRFQSSLAAAECGDLIVPEDRAKRDGATVSLHVAIFRSENPNPEPDPVIYLMGGGGGNALGAADYYLSTVGNAIRAERDFILYNQRGTHLNKPFLGCPGESAFQRELAAATLSHSYLFEFPNMGHGVMRADPCALRIGLQFLDDPLHEPDASCLAKLTVPDFR